MEKSGRSVSIIFALTLTLSVSTVGAMQLTLVRLILFFSSPFPFKLSNRLLGPFSPTSNLLFRPVLLIPFTLLSRVFPFPSVYFLPLSHIKLLMVVEVAAVWVISLRRQSNLCCWGSLVSEGWTMGGREEVGRSLGMFSFMENICGIIVAGKLYLSKGRNINGLNGSFSMLII